MGVQYPPWMAKNRQYLLFWPWNLTKWWFHSWRKRCPLYHVYDTIVSFSDIYIEDKLAIVRGRILPSPGIGPCTIWDAKIPHTGFLPVYIVCSKQCRQFAFGWPFSMCEMLLSQVKRKCSFTGRAELYGGGGGDRPGGSPRAVIWPLGNCSERIIRRGLVVKVLNSWSEGCWFDSRHCHVCLQSWMSRLLYFDCSRPSNKM
jgi:hypothetical protein